jgi:transcriptional regulator with XRE-family HTH domain
VVIKPSGMLLRRTIKTKRIISQTGFPRHLWPRAELTETPDSGAPACPRLCWSGVAGRREAEMRRARTPGWIAVVCGKEHSRLGRALLELLVMPDRGERMVEAMRLRGMTKQHALAFALGVNESTITRWKNNGPMSVNSAVQLCRALDISLDWFLNGAGTIDAPRPKPEPRPAVETGLLRRLRRVEAALSDPSKALLVSLIDSILPDDRAV